MSTLATLKELLAKRILIIDGAMGTMIQRHKLEEADYRGERFADWAYDLKGNNDLLVLTQPQIIQGIHEAYLDAGADIIETNSFNGTRVSMSDYHMEDLVPEINREAARLAKAACEKYSTPDKIVKKTAMYINTIPGENGRKLVIISPNSKNTSANI